MNPLTVFDWLWKQAAACGYCDAFGSVEHDRVFRLFMLAGAPREMLKFIVEHANRGSMDNTDDAGSVSVSQIKVPPAGEKQP